MVTPQSSPLRGSHKFYFQRSPKARRLALGLTISAASQLVLTYLRFTRHYSVRSAVVGSNPAARSAGSHEATTAIKRKRAATEINVTGSVGFTSTSMLASTRVSAN